MLLYNLIIYIFHFVVFFRLVKFFLIYNNIRMCFIFFMNYLPKKRDFQCKAPILSCESSRLVTRVKEVTLLIFKKNVTRHNENGL